MSGKQQISFTQPLHPCNSTRDRAEPPMGSCVSELKNCHFREGIPTQCNKSNLHANLGRFLLLAMHILLELLVDKGLQRRGRTPRSKGRGCRSDVERVPCQRTRVSLHWQRLFLHASSLLHSESKKGGVTAQGESRLKAEREPASLSCCGSGRKGRIGGTAGRLAETVSGNDAWPGGIGMSHSGSEV